MYCNWADHSILRPVVCTTRKALNSVVTTEFVSACVLPIVCLIMENKLGHQIMAINVDRQLTELVRAQLAEALSTFTSTAGFDSLASSSILSTECRWVVQAAYYLLSFTGPTAATPGMNGLGLALEPASGAAYAILVCSYTGLMYSLKKMSAVTTLGGKNLLL
jgi:hypothetical protein